MIDLLVIGDTAIDYFHEVESLPSSDEAVDIQSIRRFYGGMGANTAVIASGLGIKTALISAIGTDAQDYMEYMKEKGIQLDLKTIFGDTTKSLFFKTDKTQISFFYKGVVEKLDDVVPNKKLIDDANVIYMSRTYLKIQEKVVRLSKKKFVVYNPGYGIFKFSEIPPVFYKILKKTNVLVLNHHEFNHIQKLGFALDHKYGPEVFIITKGKEGCTVYINGKGKTNVDAYKTKLVDASGAGDAFNAGFIAGYIKGFNIVDCARIGNATASFTVEKWGCQTNIPSWEGVKERLERI